MSRHRSIRDAVAAHIETWRAAGDDVDTDGSRVVATWNFEKLKGLVADDDREVFGVVIAGIEDIDDQNGSRDCDSDIVIISVFHFRLLEDSKEATANTADDTTEALRDHLRSLRTIDLITTEASRLRTTAPTPFDHRELSQKATWAALIQTEYVVAIAGSSIDGEPPI